MRVPWRARRRRVGRVRMIAVGFGHGGAYFSSSGRGPAYPDRRSVPDPHHVEGSVTPRDVRPPWRQPTAARLIQIGSDNLDARAIPLAFLIQRRTAPALFPATTSIKDLPLEIDEPSRVDHGGAG